jgi:rubredoxin
MAVHFYVCQSCELVYFGVPDPSAADNGEHGWSGMCASCLTRQCGLSLEESNGVVTSEAQTEPQ